MTIDPGAGHRFARSIDRPAQTSLSAVSDDPQVTVRALLAAAGVQPPEEEIERLAGLYPGLRAAVDRFHRVDAGDEVPAAVFRAEPPRPGDATGGASR